MIAEQDLKILKSERLTDYDDGGGRVTGSEVVDRQTNNLFGDISQADRVYGKLSLRKCYPAVLTDNTDMAYGAHVAVTDPPEDPSVNVCMFSRGSWTDERAAAKDRVESFVISGPDSDFLLYGDHLSGQRVLRLACELATPSPEVGEVFRLSIEKVGYTPREQYVRILRVLSRVTQTFSQEINSNLVEFKKDVLLVETSAALRYDFPGGVPQKTGKSAPTLFRTTQVADAARYYGIAPLADLAEIGDLGVVIASPYTALVPSTQAETPLVDIPGGMGKQAIVPSGAAASLVWTGALSGVAAPDFAAARYLGMGCAKGSVRVVIGATTLTDNGSGKLFPGAGDSSGFGGTVDYAAGLVTITRSQGWSGGVSISAQPAAAITDAAQTRSIAITISNRGYNYVPTLKPIPAPGTLSVDYRALGKWIRLTDDGTGHLAGRTGEGTGTINYATGSVIVTLGALPDVGSSLLFSWSTPAHYEARNGDASIQPAVIEYEVEQPGIKPSSLSLSWLQGGVTKTATDNGAGALTGDATGSVDYLLGIIRARPATAPDANSLIQIDYISNGTHTGSEQASNTGRAYAFTIGTGYLPLKPGKVAIQATLRIGSKTEVCTWTDDGLGGLVGEELEAGATIDYATGEVALTLKTTVTRQLWKVVGWEDKETDGFSWYGGSYRYVAKVPAYGWQEGDAYITAQNPESFTWTAQENAASDDPQEEEANHGGVAFDLTPLLADQIVPGSVRFSWAGHTYVDRSGSMYRDPDAATNAATLAGAIDYATGKVRLTNYVSGSNAVTVASLLTVFGSWSIEESFFRTPGAPLKVGSLSVRATCLDGTQLSAVANGSGVLSATGISGDVDVETGIVRLAFGDLVADASLTSDEKAEPWYNPENVTGGQIWRPREVVPSSLLFNTVVFSFVPLDASLLGVDPVRLPQDGRVPMFRSGDMVLVHHTDTTEEANPQSGGTTNTRLRISYAHVYDAEGEPLPSNLYSVNLQTGVVTWADPLDLGAYSLPLTIEHRIEDLLLCSDVQITGELAFVSSLTHDFPPDESYASSVLMVGDLQARVEKFHDLAAFQSWSDTATGSEAPASFNSVLYPILVTNRGAVEERWRVTFTGSTVCNVVGEVYGQIVTGHNINDDLAPVNPQTGVPYFRMDRRGFGGGWAAGNTIRFNTRAANFPLWVARTVLQGAAEVAEDSFRLQIRADAK